MYFWAIFLLTAACADRQVGAAKSPPRPVVQFHSFDQCKGVDTPGKLLNSSISRSKQGAAAISADFYNHKVLKTFSKMELVMTKCADAVSFNTCEYVATHKFSVGLCQLIPSPSMPWATFLAPMQPPIRCPLQTGLYKLRNATVDMQKTAGSGIFDGSQGYVHLPEVRIFNEKNEMHVCFTLAFSFMRIRN
ncbi:uncharacterized protein LOC117646924 isoform X2 [Thrips palmi]|nr:uncharacterized protein LOC117646924 isoform X2 [Thrips palmi]XP_034244184.1 uncharacterized protein LOC117646924 isoform X2 [Thrips palmi]XP_034244185.1 uncharacterized protein LOC117646924 isoform X2 [Thrips palmi]XP_034244186.1 uncharacterized protein LOC117646924 isoform X2 [Thrips palmi]XP_034244187.1 uncharacterized protein LOC117646924 isoform X2 [Thrips palmi]XP_034244188.1 uncharacterized protein LOC117646924 isoform X2 [Thrips palmi]XP_034244189.1 uncharacterized protein LOC11764